jgi:hypothetical protein
LLTDHDHDHDAVIDDIEHFHDNDESLVAGSLS